MKRKKIKLKMVRKMQNSEKDISNEQGQFLCASMVYALFK